MAFEEREVPQLSLFCTLQENNKIHRIDFCPHLITFTCSPEEEDIFYVAFTAKQGYICLMLFEEGCLISKLNVEIPYAYTSKITTLKLVTVKITQQCVRNRLSKGAYLFIGFDDGIIAMYMLTETGSCPLTKIFKIKPKLSRKELVVNVQIWQNHLLLATAYNIFLFRNIFLKEEGIKNNPLSPTKKNSKETIKRQIETSKIQQQRIPVNLSESKFNLEIDRSSNNFYVFNQSEGAVCHCFSDLKQIKKLQDSIKILSTCSKLLPKGENILMIGCTDDSIKFINYDTMIVEKFVGLKNYPSCFEEDPYNNLLWVGALDGSIACFQYQKVKGQKKTSFIMSQKRLMKLRKINANGIKKIIVHQKTLIILDCNHNIQLYDIIDHRALHSANKSLSKQNEQINAFMQVLKIAQ